MGTTNLQTANGNNNTIKAALTQDQKKALGIPDSATAYLLGNKSTNGKTASFSSLVIENAGQSFPVVFKNGDSITASVSGNTVTIDDADFNKATTDSAFKDKLASITGSGEADAGRGSTDAGRGDSKDKTFMEKAGDFVEDNKFGLGGALMGLLIGMAMGGPLGLILGLLAGLFLGNMLGGMMAEEQKSNNTPGAAQQNDPEKGKGKALKKDGAPGPENAIDVKEGEKVQLVKMDGTKKTYLSGQDKDGNLIYSDTPTDITLRTQDEKGNFKSLIKGKMSGDQFFVEQAAATLPDGRMGEMTVSNRLIQLDGEGNMDLKSAAVTDARRPAAEAAAAYAKPQDIQLEVAADKSVKANLGETTFKAGDKEAKGTVELQGRMSDDGKNVTFDKVLFKDDTGNYALGANGKPIAVELPDETLKNLQVLAGNKVAPMSGDVENNKKGAAEGAVRKITARAQADVSETQSMMDTLSSTDNKSAVISGKFNNKLQALGAKDVEASLMAAEIADKYKDPEFLSKSAQERVSEVAGTFKSGTLDKLEAAAFARNMDTAISASFAAERAMAETTKDTRDATTGKAPVEDKTLSHDTIAVTTDKKRDNYVELPENERPKSTLASLVDQKDYVTLPPAVEGPKVPTDVDSPATGGAAPAPTRVIR